ncbi:MAG: hypothetical protein LZF60_380079 [Nitrospira sp.]|nr:MAG: hypothetical protein LZF60_380079 [Nitrospira sp.]
MLFNFLIGTLTQHVGKHVARVESLKALHPGDLADAVAQVFDPPAGASCSGWSAELPQRTPHPYLLLRRQDGFHRLVPIQIDDPLNRPADELPIVPQHDCMPLHHILIVTQHVALQGPTDKHLTGTERDAFAEIGTGDTDQKEIGRNGRYGVAHGGTSYSRVTAMGSKNTQVPLRASIATRIVLEKRGMARTGGQWMNKNERPLINQRNTLD